MKNKEQGRSMIEMLGVLAIISILSIAGLKGYSKAMYRYNINQTINVFQQVLEKYTEVDEKLKSGYLFGAEDLIAYGFVPDCQKIEYDGYNVCKIPSGHLNFELAFFEGNNEASHLGGCFYIHLNSVQACIDFLFVHWEQITPIEWWQPRGVISTCTDNNCAEEIFVPSEDKKALTPEIITESCQVFNENSSRKEIWICLRNTM